jgi:hypothetical protein
MKLNFQYITYIVLAGFWCYAGSLNRKYVNDKMYNNGVKLSSCFKYYPFWNNIIEPAFIRQSTVIFGGMHYFIKGMISDNDNIKEISDELKVFKMEMDEDLDNMINEENE